MPTDEQIAHEVIDTLIGSGYALSVERLVEEGEFKPTQDAALVKQDVAHRDSDDFRILVYKGEKRWSWVQFIFGQAPATIHDHGVNVEPEILSVMSRLNLW